MRGGGAGSWGVIVSITLRTFPIFNATLFSAEIFAPTIPATGTLMAAHAKHIFDLDGRAGGYFYLFSGAQVGEGGSLLALSMYFPNASASSATDAMKPFMDEVQALNLTILSSSTNTTVANDLMTDPDDSYGVNVLLGSRLIPEDVYKNDPEGIASAYEQLLELGTIE